MEVKDPPPDSMVTLSTVAPLTRWSWRAFGVSYGVWSRDRMPRAFVEMIQAEINYQQTINAKNPRHMFAEKMGVSPHPYKIKGML